MLTVLDAGCGRTCSVEIPPGARVTGLDVEADGMAMNPRLDERIVGDIESYPLGRDVYDLIVCKDVLEHLAHPEAALGNMARALKQGGLLIIGIPYVFSRKSLIAKATPHWFHVLVYRVVFGYGQAGQPGFGPFPTYLRWSLRPRALTRRAEQLGLRLVESERVGGDAYASRPLLRLLAGRPTDRRFVFERPL